MICNDCGYEGHWILHCKNCNSINTRGSDQKKTYMEEVDEIMDIVEEDLKDHNYF